MNIKAGAVLAMVMGLLASCASAEEWFVDASRPDDTGDGKSEATAKRTLAGAMKIATLADGDTVTVLPGEYDDTPMDDAWARPNRIVIKKAITLRSRDGAAKTHIVGKQADAGGRGTGAVRCVHIISPGVTIEGFTLREGCTYTGYTYNQPQAVLSGGAILFNYGTSGDPCYVVDCIIRDCNSWMSTVASANDTVANNNAVIRTLMYNNKAGKYNVATSVAFYHSVIIGLYGTNGAKFWGSGNVINCTIFDGYSWSLCAGGSPIVANTYIGGYCRFATDGGDSDRPMFYDCVSSISKDDTYMVANETFFRGKLRASSAQFTAPAYGDFRLRPNWDCEDKGSADNLTYIPQKYRYVDFNGKDFSGASKVHVGAVQTVATEAGGKLSLAGQAFDGNSAKITSDFGWSFKGNTFAQNDNLYACADAWPRTYRAEVQIFNAEKPTVFGYALTEGTSDPVTVYPLPGEDDAVELVVPQKVVTTTVKPILADALYYVDDESGMDTNPGTAELPFKTIQAAVAAAAEGKYTVIRVKPGTYAGEGRKVSEADVKSRVVLPNGKFIRLVSTGGAAVTTIKGAEDPDPPAGNAFGCGDDAVRCVYVGTNCVVQGFTLFDGHAQGEKTKDGAVTSGQGCTGGGVLAADKMSSFITDCIITNCFTTRGGGGQNGVYLRCRIVGCGVSTLGSAINGGDVYNCLIDHNRGPFAMFGHKKVVASTIGSDNLSNGAAPTPEVSAVSSSFHHSLHCGYGVDNGTLRYSVYREGCVFQDGHVWQAACQSAPESNLMLKDDGEPVVGRNAAIDYANITISEYPWALCGFYDLNCNPRISNGTMDAGAVEADWKPAYSALLAGRRVSVTSASPLVKAGAGSVQIPSGSVEVEWTRHPMSKDFSFIAAASGTGKLLILLDGEELAVLTSADGQKEIKFTSSAAKVNLSFTYLPGASDTGYGEIASFVNRIGMALILR